MPKKPMSYKSKAMKDLIDEVFPNTLDSIESGKCPVCKDIITGFRNLDSAREYEISGLCQKCQDSVFGVD